MARTVRSRSGSPPAFSARRRRRMVASTVRSSTSWSRAPHQIEQLAAREHPAGALQQLAQQAELGRAEVHLAAAARAPDAPRGPCVRSAKRRTSRGERRADPAQHRAHARDQLVERERLGDVVVGAGVQPAQPVGLLAARGQHDDRQIRGRRLAAQLAAQLEAGHATAASSRAAPDRACCSAISVRASSPS